MLTESQVLKNVLKSSQYVQNILEDASIRFNSNRGTVEFLVNCSTAAAVVRST